MKIRYIYSACIEIHTTDICILTDPWFTEGAYDGSWYHFPKIENPLEVISEPDLIYISHIHPDHYDPIFLTSIFERWGKKPILIPHFNNNHLLKKMWADGFDASPITSKLFDKTSIHIIPNVTGSASDIDSALYVNDNKHSILNLNDCIWNDDHINAIQSLIDQENRGIDLLALGYTGAGAFPQTYFDIDNESEILNFYANQKKEEFFKRYKNFTSAFPSRYHLPFAGKYILGGRLSKLNKFRGVADPLEVAAFDNKAIILADGGEGSIDLDKDQITKTRDVPYSKLELRDRIDSISTNLMDYETHLKLPADKINFKRMLIPSYERAIKKTRVTSDYYFLIEPYTSSTQTCSYILNANQNNPSLSEFAQDQDIPEPCSQIIIDYRYLFGLLTGLYHWDNAEIGSHYRTIRKPNTHNREVQRFLHFLSLC